MHGTALPRNPRKMTTSSTQFEPILAALRVMDDTGPSGFEGLVRDALEVLCGHKLYLVKSGAQKGKDIAGDPSASAPRIAIESKRFRGTTHLALDEMKQKLQEACETDDLDTWGIALSKEMVEPDWSEVRQIAEKHGVVPVVLDWRDANGSLPVLAAIVANARGTVESRLTGIPAGLIDKVIAHPQYDATLQDLRPAKLHRIADGR